MGHADGRYRLTSAGRQLGDALRTLGDWAAQWIIEDPAPAELDPELLGLWLSRHVAGDELPTQRVVIDFDLRGPKPGRIWLVLERDAEPSVCLTDPCLSDDAYVYVQAETRELYRVYMGRIDLSTALGNGSVSLFGTPDLVRQFGRWFSWSRFSPTVRAARSQPRAS